MPEKQQPNKSVAVRPDTYDRIVEISKWPHMLAENGRTRSYTDVMSDIVELYFKVAKKGKP